MDDLEDAEVVSIEYCKLYLSDVMPTDLPTADDCNEFAKYVAEMLETDGEYLKFLSVLKVEQPEDFAEVLNIAADLDDYERVLEGTEEYGRYVLERIGMDDEMIDIVEGYMDLDEFGSDWMEEDGVRTTEFGSVRRLSSPFEDTEFRQEMGGM